MADLVTAYASELPVDWVDRLISHESGADVNYLYPHGQYHQFRAKVNDGSNAGEPNDRCGCPEGIGLGQIDFHTGPDADGFLTPAQVKNPDFFWDWMANLYEGVKHHLYPYKSYGIANWGNDVGSAGGHGLAPRPTLAEAKTPGTCNFVADDSHFQWAYEMDGYNSGGNARYTKVAQDQTTHQWKWVLSHSYFNDVCRSSPH